MTDSTYQTVSPLADPVAAAAATRAVEEANRERQTPAWQTYSLKPLPVTSLRLPGGYLKPDGTYEFDVEVRELNGEDEEALAKGGNIAKALMTILNRATVKVGDEPVTSEILDSLLAGDREAILLQIRKATYGTTETVSMHCSSCRTDQDLEIDLDEDVPVKRLEDPDDRYWTMSLKAGEAQLVLPDGTAQRKVAINGAGKSIAELNTVIIAECLHSIGGAPSMGVGTARALGLADRAAIIESIAERQPGPQLGEVVKKCECGADIEVGLNLALLFRL